MSCCKFAHKLWKSISHIYGIKVFQKMLSKMNIKNKKFLKMWEKSFSILWKQIYSNAPTNTHIYTLTNLKNIFRFDSKHGNRIILKLIKFYSLTRKILDSVYSLKFNTNMKSYSITQIYVHNYVVYIMYYSLGYSSI